MGIKGIFQPFVLDRTSFASRVPDRRKEPGLMSVPVLLLSLVAVFLGFLGCARNTVIQDRDSGTDSPRDTTTGTDDVETDAVIGTGTGGTGVAPGTGGSGIGGVSGPDVGGNGGL